MTGDGPPGSELGRGRAGWLTWLVGLAALAAVVLVAVHFAEARELVRLARRARPEWLVLAVALQVPTYVFQAEVWQTVLRPAKAQIGTVTMYGLTLARLAIDQAIPSAGLSGTLLAAKALEQRRVPRPVVMAGVAIDTASCYIVYALGLAAALVITVTRHHATVLVVTGAAVFFAFALALTAAFLGLSGRGAPPFAHRVARLAPLAAGLRMLAEADPRLSRSPRLLVRASACQLAVVLLDAGTLWALIAALGATASGAGVFASFMMSTLLRLVGVLPGGLGTFEATSVVTLRLMGVSLPVSLSATLLFRWLSFWLPLAPGLWLARRYTSSRAA
jgi:Mg2+-importing ATPase